MTDPIAPLAERLTDVGSELSRHVEWICESLFRAEDEAATHQAWDRRVLHWRADGQAKAYQEILLVVFGLNWMDIAQRRNDYRVAASRSKKKVG